MRRRVSGARWTGGGREALALAVTVVLAAGAASCGDDNGPGDSRSASRAAPRIDYVKQPDDVGTAPALRRLVDLLARMQRDFRAGEMRSVCASVSVPWLSQFPPNARRPDAPCEAKLEEFARRLERAGTAPRTLEIAWARIYDQLAGITVRGDGMPRTRIPFVPEDGRWKLQLGVFPEPEVLNDRLSVN